MTTCYFIFIALIIFPFMAHGQQNKKDSGKIIVQDVQLVEIVDMQDDVDLPPPNFISKFKTLQDWLINICDNDKPKQPIQKYKFGLFESTNDYTVFVAGVNTYSKGNYRSIRIAFKPTNMYLKLPKDYFENLTREQLLDKLTSELKDFASTEKFKNSFFTKAGIVVLETNGQTIWSK